MYLHITRDSVCAADDFDPDANSRRCPVNNDMSVEEIVLRVCKVADLPRITGGRATWCVSSNQPLAIVAQQSPTPKFVRSFPPQLDELDIRDDGIWFHISYFEQEDPDLVYNVLERLTLRSR